MIQQLAVYDESGTQIGMTFPKRARQLINKQRALWNDDTHTSIRLVPDSAEDAPGYPKDDRDGALVLSGSDDLLLYRAKKNVSEKRNLVKHVVAYIAIWPVILLFYAAILSRITHPAHAQVWDAIAALDDIRQYVPLGAMWSIYTAERHVHGIVNSLTHPFMYVIIGFMIAWAAWIIARVIKRIVTRIIISRTFVRKAKPDPVQMEYQRLKDMSAMKY